MARTGYDSEMNGCNASGNRMSWMHELPRPNRIHDQPIDASVCESRDLPSARSMRAKIAWGRTEVGARGSADDADEIEGVAANYRFRHRRLQV
jgi:hypothetical protein